MTVGQLRSTMAEGQVARSTIVAANAGLVGSIAKRYFKSVVSANQANGGMGTILSFHDLVQEGNLGLMEAAERFEPERGFRFSTYATWWVRQRMLRAISDYSRIIRLPAHGKF
jgi:RNA polymerase primary sigma factor